MIFTKSILPLGEGRVTHARANGDGIAEIFCAQSGGTVLKKVDLSSRAVKTGDVVSYAAACFFFFVGFLEKSALGFGFASF